MLAPTEVEGFTDGEGRRCLLVPAPPGERGWYLLACRGPRTLVGVAGKGPAAPGVRRALGGLGSFGIVEDEDTRRALAAALADPRRPVQTLVAAAGAATIHCALGDVSIRRLRSLDGRCGRGAVDRIATEHPHLMPVIGLVDERLRPDAAAGLVIAAGRGDAALCRALRLALDLPPAGPGPDPLRALVRGLRGVPLSGYQGADALAVACRLPADWMPRGAGAARAFGILAGLVRALAERSRGALTPEALLAPSRGRWEPFLDAVARAAGPAGTGLVPGHGAPAAARAEAETAARALVDGVADMVAAFCAQCAAPAACRIEATDADPADLDYATERLCRELVRDPAGLASGAWTVLFGEKGLVAVLRGTAEWHARQQLMDLALRGAADPRTWPVPFPPFVSSGGRRLVPLSSAAELAAEGAALRHCVGGYAGKCIAGESVIVSVRTADGSRSSTAELVLARDGPGARLVQHKALLNAPPVPEDAAAVASLLVAIAAGRQPVARPGPPARRRLAVRLGLAWEEPPEPEGDALRDTCGYDWRRPGLCEAALGTWAPFLPRGPCRSEPAALVRALGLSGRLLNLPAARVERRVPRRTLRLLPRLMDALVPVFGLAFMGVALAEAARNLAAPVPEAPAMPGLAGDAVLVWALASITAGNEASPCPDWTASEGAPIRCGRRGGLIAVDRGREVSAHLVTGGRRVELFRGGRDATGRIRAVWPSGPDWRPWLASAAAGRPL